MDILRLSLMLVLTMNTTGEMNIEVGIEDNGEVVMVNSSVVVLADQNRFTLWCDGDSGGWDVCKWYRPNFEHVPSDSDSCLFAVNSGTCPQAPGFSEWEVSRRNTRCSLSVGPVNSNDVGLWRCLLLPKNSGNGSKFQEVGLERQDIHEPDIKFDPGAGITLHEGDSQSFMCNTSAIINTEPSSSWRVGQTSFPGSVTATEGDPDQGVSSWTISSVLDYTAIIADSGKDIICIVTLSDDFSNTVEFSASWSGLSVSPVVVTKKAGMADWKILLIVLVPLLFILILIILIASCWFFGCVCFSGREKERSQVAEDPTQFYQADMQSTIPSKPEKPNPSKRKLRNPAPYVDIDSLPPSREPRPRPRPSLTLPWDPYSDCPDQLAHYSYQGESSSAGSLSSLASMSDEDKDMDMGAVLGRMGNRFSNLARLYKEESSEEEEEGDNSQGDNVSYESWV